MKKLHFTSKFILQIAFFILLQFSVKAQSLIGKIFNNNGQAMLNGASVYIPDLKIGSVSKNDGHYIINNIPNGTYLVEVSFVGYATHTQKVIIKGVTTINFSLNITSIEAPEVVVTGVAIATEQKTNPAPVSIVGQNTLLETVSNNIIDALRNSPGVTQITQGPAISKPIVRGLGYNRVVVVNDGIRQEGQQFGDEFGIEIDPYTVNKVEILRGPASLIYGSDAMAGVINMISSPTLSDGELKGNIQSNRQTNNGLYGGSVNIAGNHKGITFDARYTNTDAHAYKNKYDGFVFNSGYALSNFKGSIGINRKWGFSKIIVSDFNLKLGIIEGGRDEHSGQFNKHVKASDGKDSVMIVSDNELKSYNHDLIIHQLVQHKKIVWDNSFAIGNGRLGIRVGYQQNQRHEANDATLGNVYNIYYFLKTLSYDVNYNFAEKNNIQLTIGTSGMKQSSQNKGLLFLVPAYQVFDMGIFAIAKKSFDKLSITGGLRFDNRTLHGDGLYLDSSGKKTSINLQKAIHRFNEYNSNFSGLSGSLGATYDFTKTMYGKINLSRAFRAPNIAESGSNGIHDGTPFYEIGDPNLKPEQSWQLDATMGINTNNFSAELTLFNNHINNYIFPEKLASVFGGDSIRTDVTSATQGPTFKFISGNAVLWGGELTLKYHPQNASWFHLDNVFSMVNAVQKKQPDSTKYLPYTPPYKLVSTVEFIAKKLSNNCINAYLRFDMENCLQQDKIYYKFDNETITPAYTLLNIGVGMDVAFKQRTIFSFNCYIRNLADIAYQSNLSRLKYTDHNPVTNRIGTYEMGRSVGFKINVPLNLKNSKG